MTWMVSGTHIRIASGMRTRGCLRRRNSDSDGGATLGMTLVVAIDVPSAEPDARIEEGVANIRDDLRQHRDEDPDQRRRLDDVDVAEQRRVKQQLAEAGILEEDLDDDDAGEQPIELQDDDREGGDE